MRPCTVLVFGALSLAFLMIGCQDTPLVGPTSELGNSSDAVISTASGISTAGSGSAAKGRVAQSVTGSGHFRIDGKLRIYAFTARRYDDGSVDGQWQLITRGSGNASESHFHGKVTCLNIDGNHAWIGGFESGVELPNNGVGWRVVDNGQGKNALQPDKISDQFFSASQVFVSNYCATTPNSPPLHPVKAGNIKIHQ